MWETWWVFNNSKLVYGLPKLAENNHDMTCHVSWKWHVSIFWYVFWTQDEILPFQIFICRKYAWAETFENFQTSFKATQKCWQKWLKNVIFRYMVSSFCTSHLWALSPTWANPHPPIAAQVLSTTWANFKVVHLHLHFTLQIPPEVGENSRSSKYLSPENMHGVEHLLKIWWFFNIFSIYFQGP